MTTSRADFFFSGWMSTGMPRPYPPQIPAVGMDGDDDPIAHSRQGFIDRVVDYFINQVVKCFLIVPPTYIPGGVGRLRDLPRPGYLLQRKTWNHCR